MRLTSAPVLLALAFALLFVLATATATSAQDLVTDPDAPIVICAALICTHPFGLYDYDYYLPVIESAAIP